MEYGSIYGHGAYLGPDFTADYLHRAALLVIDEYGGPSSDQARARTITDFTSGSDRLDFAAVSGLTTIQGAMLDTILNAHSVAWVVGSNNTIDVYANVSGSAETIGGNAGVVGLMAMQVDLPDFHARIRVPNGGMKVVARRQKASTVPQKSQRRHVSGLRLLKLGDRFHRLQPDHEKLVVPVVRLDPPCREERCGVRRKIDASLPGFAALRDL
jgi:hypothetical protein